MVEVPRRLLLPSLPTHTLHQVLDKYNATSAYIATDDPTVIGQLQTLAPDVHWYQ